MDRKETASKSTALTVETLGEDSSGGRNLTAPLQPGQHEGHEQGAPGGKPLVATPTPLSFVNIYLHWDPCWDSLWL